VLRASDADRKHFRGARQRPIEQALAAHVFESRDRQRNAGTRIAASTGAGCTSS
jgi:hypothetical protein